MLSLRICHGETDLQILIKTDLDLNKLQGKISSLILKYRGQIDETIRKCPWFLHSLVPIELKSDYEIINEMIAKARVAGVGPMAGVAGAFAEFIGNDLLPIADELIIENGGDIFIKTIEDRNVLIYAGEHSPFKDKVKIKLHGQETPRGICTSSKQVGHSLSFGNTDATIIVAQSVITADVFATAIGNMVKSEEDIKGALSFVEECNDISGGLILIGDKIAAWGEIEFTP
jgi:ApbE superfamily uncharacterized protein (UPF0280 family)